MELEQNVDELAAGTYMDQDGRTHKVLGIAQHQTQNTRLVIYIPSYGDSAGQLLAEEVGEYLSKHRREGQFRYHGPFPRLPGTNRPSPNIFAKQ